MSFANPSKGKSGIQQSNKRKGGRKVLNPIFLEDRLAKEHIRLRVSKKLKTVVLLLPNQIKQFLTPIANLNRSSEEDRSYLPPKKVKKNRLQYVKGNVKISCVQQKNLV